MRAMGSEPGALIEQWATAREREYLDSLSPRARQILGAIVDRYEAHGVEYLWPRVL